jgi:hypothetical protein
MIDVKPFPSRVLSSTSTDVNDLDTRLRDLQAQVNDSTAETTAAVPYQPAFTGISTGTPTITGQYVQLGPMVWIQITMTPSSGGDISAPSSNTISLPLPSAGFALFPVSTGTDGQGAIGNAITSANKNVAILPNFSAIANVVNLSGWYLASVSS